MTTSIPELTPIDQIERAARQLFGGFETAIVTALECGSLLAMTWHIHEEEHSVAVEERSNFVVEAKRIEARWIEIERLHGEGSLLVEESKVIQYSLATRGGRHDRKPHLLENARRLREVKGLEWWQREHQLRPLLEEIRSHINCSSRSETLGPN